MQFLEAPPDRGLPAEYLLSRVMGRSSHMIHDWNALVHDPRAVGALLQSRYAGLPKEKAAEAVWTGLVKEYRWIYSRMSRRTRMIFEPFFLYSELRTLFICLRRLKGKNMSTLGDLLGASLLHKNIKKALNSDAGLLPAMAEIERALLTLTGDVTGITRLVQDQGLREAEQRITGAYLLYVVKSGVDPLMRNFFMMIIDARNIISIYKFIRLGAKATPRLLPGGSVSMKRLSHVLERSDLTMLPELIREACGISFEKPDTKAGQVAVEAALYRGLSKILRKGGRDPLSMGLMLDYLWRCSLEAMNLSLILHGGLLERDVVLKEIVE